MVKVVATAWPILFSLQNWAGYFTGRIAPDERILFFPSSAAVVVVASSIENATNSNDCCYWQVPIHGWIFQPKESSKKRAAFRSLLRRALQVKPRSSEERILDHRIKAFVVDNEGWRRPKITLGEKEYPMPSSSKNGHFQTTLMISNEDLLRLPPIVTATNGSSSDSHILKKSVNFFALSSDGNQRYEGTVHLVPPKGITILSDIDDTIKVTNVTNKREMLRNTFMREFEPVPGMAKVYQKWCSSGISNGTDPHVHLHFLSASMYQLYEELEAFRQRCGFPPATYSLKTVRPKNAAQTIRTLLEDPLEFKRRALKQLFDTYPQRNFVLVGDTGEKDPQVYASIAQEYPDQVLAIFLRYVSKGPNDNVKDRVQQTMTDYVIENTKWTVFEDASELMEVDLSKLFP